MRRKESHQGGAATVHSTVNPALAAGRQNASHSRSGQRNPTMTIPQTVASCSIAVVTARSSSRPTSGHAPDIAASLSASRIENR